MYIYICIYIYIERERCVYTCVYTHSITIHTCKGVRGLLLHQQQDPGQEEDREARQGPAVYVYIRMNIHIFI